jgi:hypothetical protein
MPEVPKSHLRQPHAVGGHRTFIDHLEYARAAVLTLGCTLMTKLRRRQFPPSGRRRGRVAGPVAHGSGDPLPVDIRYWLFDKRCPDIARCREP